LLTAIFVEDRFEFFKFLIEEHNYSMKAYDLERNNTFIIASSNERLEVMDYLIDHGGEEVVNFKSKLTRHREANRTPSSSLPRLRARHPQNPGTHQSQSHIAGCLRRHSLAFSSKKLPHPLSANYAPGQSSIRQGEQISTRAE
jgi:hypothetical protein